jgi:hypothetical protein
MTPTSQQSLQHVAFSQVARLAKRLKIIVDRFTATTPSDNVIHV